MRETIYMYECRDISNLCSCYSLRIYVHVSFFAEVSVFVRVHCNLYIRALAFLYIRMSAQAAKYIVPVRPE